jgi:hypothetical protein
MVFYSATGKWSTNKAPTIIKELYLSIDLIEDSMVKQISVIKIKS